MRLLRLCVKGSLYVRRALHCTYWLLFGQSWNCMCWRAQLFVFEQTGGHNILMSGWVASYFSPGSAWVVFILGICSPLLGSCPSCFESTCASDRGLGDRDCAQKKSIFTNLKKRFEHIELPAKLLDYFLRSNKSNINPANARDVVLARASMTYGVRMTVIYIKMPDVLVRQQIQPCAHSW